MHELRRRQIRSILITACIFAVLAATIGVLVSAGLFWRANTHKGWLVHVAPDTLVQSSQHIIVARYEDEAVHEIPNSSLYPNAPTSFTDVYRRFEVLESLKGDFEPGATVYVGWNAGYTITNPETAEPEFRPREVLPIPEDADYALFLNWLWARSRHPDDPQTRIWGTPKGLGIALVDSRGRLSFQTNDYYRAALKDLGFEPVPGSGAPFELTTDGVKELLAAEYASPQ